MKASTPACKHELPCCEKVLNREIMIFSGKNMNTVQIEAMIATSVPLQRKLVMPIILCNESVETHASHETNDDDDTSEHQDSNTEDESSITAEERVMKTVQRYLASASHGGYDENEAKQRRSSRKYYMYCKRN